MSRVPVKIIAPAALRAKHVGYILPNGVRCVLVQDPNAKIPAAAMCIAAGQLNDPHTLPGLAHFCEHMLFMGTEKFPKEDEYDSYISKNNGFNNAFTADRATVYYFSVSDAALDGALARFVEFFVAPTFNESAVNREVQAVHSEDEKNHSVDYWRADEIYRGMYNSKHARSRYGNGNQTTLVDEPKAKGINLREELKAFYHANYVAEGACIAVYSAREPEEVLKLIEEPLLRMRAGKRPQFAFTPRDENLFTPAALGSWMNLKTVRKTRAIRIRWPVRSPTSLWKADPGAYISHILGHECDSSVLGVLKKRDWATGMMAGGARGDDDYDVFSVSISLTLEGFRHVTEVIGLIYEYVGLAINNGVNEAVYAQLKAEQRLGFESQEVSSASSHCTALAMNAMETDLEHCIIGGDCILKDYPEATLAYARQLTPDNGQVTLMWGSLPSQVVEDGTTAAATAADGAADEGEEEEGADAEDEEDAATTEELFASLPQFAQMAADTAGRFHKAEHAITQIPTEVLGSWKRSMENPTCADLALPAVNPFITTDFTVFPSASETAVAETFHSPRGTTIVRKDANHHNTFKCAIHWSPISPVAFATALNRFYTQVMARMVEDHLTELSYYGELASLENKLVRGAGGPGLSVTGPYQHLPTFFSKVLAELLQRSTMEGTAEKFATYSEEYIRQMESRANSQPYEHAVERLSKIATFVNYTFEDILAVAPQATYEGYKAFTESFMSSGMLFECFIAGNIPSAKEIVDSVVGAAEARLTEASVPIPDKSTITRFRDSLDLSCAGAEATAAEGSTPITAVDLISLPPFSPKDPNVSTLLEVYVGETTARNAALCSVAAKLFSSLFFNALRTKEALGYIVFSQYRPILRGSHIVFGAQSAVSGVDGVYLLSRIVAFLSALEERLEVLCVAEELEKITASLIQGLEKMPDSVAQDASQLMIDYLSPIGMNNREERIKTLRAVTVEDMKDFFRAFVFNGRTDAKALAIVVNSARTQQSSLLPQGGAGKHILRLPAQRAKTEEEAADAAPLEDGDITLPTYDGDSAPTIEVNVVESLEAYRKDRAVLRDGTF